MIPVRAVHSMPHCFRMAAAGMDTCVAQGARRSGRRGPLLRLQSSCKLMAALILVISATIIGVASEDWITLRVYHGNSAPNQTYMVECHSSYTYNSVLLQEPGDFLECSFTNVAAGTELWCSAWLASNTREVQWIAYKQQDEEDPKRPQAHTCESNTCQWMVNDEELSYYLHGTWLNATEVWSR